MQEAEQQGVASARPADIAQVAALEGGGFSGELADLGMRDILEERSRVEDAIERDQPLGPFANVFQGGRTRGLLQSGKAIEPIPFGDVEQGVQGLALLVAQGPGDALIKGFVNFLGFI